MLTNQIIDVKMLSVILRKLLLLFFQQYLTNIDCYDIMIHNHNGAILFLLKLLNEYASARAVGA